MTQNINAKEIWLNYFNDYLFERGIITEKEKSKMSAAIRKQCGNGSKTTNRHK